MSAVSVSEPEVRPVLVDAADLARRALVELEPNGVGSHLGVTAEGDSAATHRFESTLPGYRGWQWAVVVAAPPGAEHATVSESALLPGPEALVAPDFIPWEQRIRPGDLAPGDLLAPPADDPRLVPGYVANGDPEIDELAREVGLGRTKVLSLEGRAEAAERWYAEHGPDTDMARAAPGMCGTCGFYLPLAGALRAAFGVCGNAMGADGMVVHVEYGCGAHSDVELPAGSGSPRHEAYDDAAVDLVPAAELRRPEPAAEVAASLRTAEPDRPAVPDAAVVSDDLAASDEVVVRDEAGAFQRAAASERVHAAVAATESAPVASAPGEVTDAAGASAERPADLAGESTGSATVADETAPVEVSDAQADNDSGSGITDADAPEDGESGSGVTDADVPEGGESGSGVTDADVPEDGEAGSESPMVDGAQVGESDSDSPEPSSSASN